jgi:hypothetical protein
MKITFKYDKEKDIWCLINKGPSSINSAFPTGVYKKFTREFGDSPTKENINLFIDKYLKENNFNINIILEKYQKDFSKVSEEFYRIAEKVFGLSLNDKEIVAYLTINNRCPYDIKENWFFVSINKLSPTTLIMHELWHFYTWYKFGDKEEKIGIDKYNDIKEALSVLLNLECKHLLPEGISDNGYPQHQELREKIKKLWIEKSDINYVWDKIEPIC